MTQMFVLLILVGTISGAMLYGRHQAKSESVAEWAVGGRKLGFLVFWFLNAGEVYTTFAVLGISGFAWAHGAPAYLAFCSVSLSAALGYWLTPLIWRAGRDRGLVTQADYFADRYQARWLGVVVGIAGIAALVMYVQIQITALSLVLRMTVGDVSPVVSAIAAATLMVAFVFFAGIRSAAFAAGVKDILMAVIMVILCTTVASHVGASSILDIFAKVEALHVGIGRLPGIQPGAGLGEAWLMNQAISVAIGTYIFPHMFQLCFSASDEWTVRRNAIWQPIYSLSYFFIILLGLAALVAGVHPPGGDMNGALLQFVSDRYPAWTIGVLIGTVYLLALVPGSVLLLTAGSIFSRNIYLQIWPQTSERACLRISRLAMIGFAAVAVWLTIDGSGSLVEIGLSAYKAIEMLAPGVFLGFLWRRTHAVGVAAGLAAGYAAMLWPWMVDTGAFAAEIDPALKAMLLNALVTVVVSLTLPRRDHATAQDALVTK